MPSDVQCLHTESHNGETTMHIDYAKETIEYYERNFANYDMMVLESFCVEPEFLAVAISFGDKKITGICETIKEIQDGYGSRYRKITSKQRYALAKFLLDNLGSAKSVIAKAFNTTVNDMFPA